MSSEKVTKKIHRYGLTIGINYYTLASGSGRLNGCINDAIAHRDLLVSRYNYNETDIVLMKDDESNNFQDPMCPTRSNILEQIKILTDKIKACDPNDECYVTVAYSGHGSYRYDYSGDEKDGRDESLVPADYMTGGMIIDDEWKAKLIDPVADLSNIKLTVIMDCCHSGTNNDLRATYSPRLNYPERYAVNENYSKTKAKIFMLSGCLDHEYSYDGFEEGKYAGAMSYCLHKTLAMFGYRLTYTQLTYYVNLWLSYKGYPQMPQLTHGDENDNLHELFSF